MARHAQIAVSHVHAGRARELAAHLGIPVGALVSTLIDGAYQNEFDIRPGRVMLVGNTLMIDLGDRPLAVARDQAAGLAGKIRKVIDGGFAFVDLDTSDMLEVTRRGTGIVFETTAKDGTRGRTTMGKAEATRLADEIESHA